MSKKVFPIDQQTRTARQRADLMLARSAGIVNNDPNEEPKSTQQQMRMSSFDDDQSQVVIQSR